MEKIKVRLLKTGEIFCETEHLLRPLLDAGLVERVTEEKQEKVVIETKEEKFEPENKDITIKSLNKPKNQQQKRGPKAKK